MIEFSAQTGGRYTYADDLENLQELALAFAQIFDDCDNFIVSGCEVSGSTINAGYVYLNGKLRYFSGASNLTWPQYIYEANSTVDVPYENGGSKVGRNCYGCNIASSVPSSIDSLTGKVRQSITINATGGLRLKDAFLGKYALLLNPASGTQSVNSYVNFQRIVRCNNGLTANHNFSISFNGRSATLSFDNGTFTISTLKSNGAIQYKFEISDDNGFRFYAGSTLMATIGDTVVFNVPIQSNQASFNGLILNGHNIYQGSDNRVADLYINYMGYDGGFTQYRNTFIGNGKSKSILSIKGAEATVGVAGVLNVSPSSDVTHSLVLKSALPKTNYQMINAIGWKDSNGDTLAQVGFISSSSQKFYISCAGYGVEIRGASTVNITPTISEKGVLLSDKYAPKSETALALNGKANATDVYTMAQANSIFAIKRGGLSQFITDSVTADTCRQQIGAAASSTLNSYAKLSNYLADMATTDEAKRKIRNNIGALGASDQVMSDTGWIKIKDALYIRQIGNIVSIQGSVTLVHSGTQFTIPNNIQPPTHGVKHVIAFNGMTNWVGKIAANQRDCTVVNCNGGCEQLTEFSLTYMV